MNRSVNILGTEYTIVTATREEYPYLKEADGFMDPSVKKVVVADMKKIYKDEQGLKEDLKEYERKCLRHEIIHAFMYESGLSINSNNIEAWADNEEMIDWVAIQYPKIRKIFTELKIND